MHSEEVGFLFTLLLKFFLDLPRELFLPLNLGLRPVLPTSDYQKLPRVLAMLDYFILLMLKLTAVKLDRIETPGVKLAISPLEQRLKRDEELIKFKVAQILLRLLHLLESPFFLTLKFLNHLLLRLLGSQRLFLLENRLLVQVNFLLNLLVIDSRLCSCLLNLLFGLARFPQLHLRVILPFNSGQKGI